MKNSQLFRTDRRLLLSLFLRQGNFFFLSFQLKIKQFYTVRNAYKYFKLFISHDHEIHSEFEFCPRINNHRPEPHIIPFLRHTFFILSVSPAGDLQIILKSTFVIFLLKRILPLSLLSFIRDKSALPPLHFKPFNI